MSLFEDTNPRELKELLGQIHSREAALPDFQRDFVWDPNATQELIVSIASNYPAGSLLRIRNTHDLFANREFQGAPALDGHRPTYLVLDGQQRLTSLYQAFYGVGDHRYYLDLHRLMDGVELEECIFHLRANAKRATELANLETQAAALVLPLSALKSGASGFLPWSMNVAQSIATPSEQFAFVSQLGQLAGPWIQTIDDYRFPVVTLSDQTNAEAVCTIFETLNRTGVKLSPFELLTARFWPQNVNLRHLWAKAQAQAPIITDFDVDPYYLLQAVSLVSGHSPSCKRSDVLALRAEAINHWWEPCVSGLAEGLAILRQDCGVLTKDWLPIYPLLVTLAAVLARESGTKGAKQGAIRDKIGRWFWCSALGGKYESGPNSQATKDFGELRDWFAGGNPPETVTTFQFDPRVLRETTFRQRALYRALMCVILRRQPRDFFTGAVLNEDLIIERHVDDHHIFPRAWLENSVYAALPARLRDSILNRTLIDRKTNISIGKRAPSVYLAEIRDALGAAFLPLLASHLLPSGVDSPLWTDDFEKFLELRQAAFWHEIQTLTGLDTASDLLDAELALPA